MEMEVKEIKDKYYIIEGETIIDGPFDFKREADDDLLTWKVINQIKEDISFLDYEAIFELLRYLPVKFKKGYLSE